MNWKLAIRWLDDVVIFDVLKFNRSNYKSEELLQVVVDHLAKGGRNILINLANERGIDDAAIGELVSCHSNALKYSANLALVGVHKNTYAFLEISKLTTILKIFGSETEALKSFS